MTSKFSPKTLHFFTRQDLCLRHAELIDKWRVRLGEGNLQGIGIESLQSLNAFCRTGTKFFGALHTLKKPGTG